METKTQVCPTPGCGNICEVRVSTGHKNPDNKGREYISCPKCDKFSWAGLTNIATPELPKTPSMKPPGTPTAHPARDFESEAEGKCRHAYLLEAFKKDLPLTKELLDETNRWTQASMTGEYLEPKG